MEHLDLIRCHVCQLAFVEDRYNCSAFEDDDELNAGHVICGTCLQNSQELFVKCPCNVHRQFLKPSLNAKKFEKLIFENLEIYKCKHKECVLPPHYKDDSVEHYCLFSDELNNIHQDDDEELSRDTINIYESFRYTIFAGMFLPLCWPFIFVVCVTLMIDEMFRDEYAETHNQLINRTTDSFMISLKISFFIPFTYPGIILMYFIYIWLTRHV